MRVASSIMLVTALALGAVPATAGPAAPSPSGWSVMPSPNRPAPAGARLGAALSGITCPTSTNCLVVGAYRDNDYTLPLVGERRGSSWSIGAAPQPPPGNHPRGELSAVVCVAGDRCFGAGNFYGVSTRALVELWNGRAWSVVPNPKMPGTTRSSLSGIACPTSTSCFAVGDVLRAGGQTKTLIEHWNGRSWSVVPGASPPGGGTLSGIACATSIDCVAVGSTNPPHPRTLAVHWNGAGWKVVTSPNPVGVFASELTNVACSTAQACVAVGRYFVHSYESSTALAERWDGNSWSLVATRDKPRTGSGEGTELSGITCVTAAACFAVGSITSNFDSAPRVERWNGQSWSVVPIDDPNQFTSENLASITCASTASCIAVGSSFYGTLIEKWDGSHWSEIPAGGSASELTAISCPTATTCFAVGGSAPGFRYFSDNAGLIERWNGTSWKIVASPDAVPAYGFAQLRGISCPTTASCFAVGVIGSTNGNYNMLIKRWDGTRWTRVPVPDPPGVSSTVLRAVSCPSASSCFAIGDGESSNSRPSFVERWDGTAWSAQILAAQADGYMAGLAGISCESASACVAVGGAGAGTLVETWDGVAWSVVPSPSNPGATSSYLESVTCPAVDRCFAVGFNFYADPYAATGGDTLIEEWDGTAWSIVPSPNPASAVYSRFASVACSTGADCFAVGASFATGSSRQTAFIEHWDGTNWSLVPIANPAGALESQPSGISCVSSICTAVGASESATARRTLVARPT